MAEGIVVSMHLASRATEPMRGVAEARAVPGRGLEGDRYFEGRGTSSGSPDTELTLVEVHGFMNSHEAAAFRGLTLASFKEIAPGLPRHAITPARFGYLNKGGRQF